MIKELAEFGKHIREINADTNDALCIEPISYLIEINRTGQFINLYPSERSSLVEDVVRTQDAGRTSGIVPRLIVDNCQYVLGYPRTSNRAKSCFEAYKSKINDFGKVEDIKPILNFYSNINEGIDKAYISFDTKIKQKEIDGKGNLAFVLSESKSLIHESKSLFEAITEKYLIDEIQRKKKSDMKCSICNKSDYRSNNISVHGVIKKVPDGQPAGCSLVSYNADAFESYNLDGNDNANICTNCIKNYVYGFNWLLSNDISIIKVDKKGKEVKINVPTNRRNFGKDTAMVYWTREETDLAATLNILDNPDEGQVASLLDSVASGQYKSLLGINANQFYSLTLSGAAARIAIRDWIQISLDDYYRNIAAWFQRVKIKRYDSDAKELKIYYPSLYRLAQACYKKESNDDSAMSRVAKHLWNTALKQTPPPLWILTLVLKRIAHNESTPEGKSVNTMTPERASLIRLILNLNNKGDRKMLNEELDLNDSSLPVLCGRLFALIEGIQRAALGNEINAGVRERFFSAASTSPSPAFGRLLKQMQNHLTKLKQDKPGLAFILDKEVQELCSKIENFPATFTLEQQGQFALGYYHQKHYNFNRAKNEKEFQSLTENNLED